MDKNEINANTRVLQGDVGFNLATNKPTVSGFSDNRLPTTGYYNPPIPLDQWYSRLTHYENTTITTDAIYSIRIDSAFIQKPANAMIPIFDNKIAASAIEFRVILHIPSNANGKFAAWFNPENTTMTDALGDQMHTSLASPVIVEAMNLDAVFVNLDEATEIKYIVTLPYSSNILPVTHYFGNFKYGLMFKPQFGTGVNSLDVQVYYRLLDPTVGPLLKVT